MIITILFGTIAVFYLAISVTALLHASQNEDFPKFYKSIIGILMLIIFGIITTVTIGFGIKYMSQDYAIKCEQYEQIQETLYKKIQ